MAAPTLANRHMNVQIVNSDEADTDRLCAGENATLFYQAFSLVIFSARKAESILPY